MTSMRRCALYAGVPAFAGILLGLAVGAGGQGFGGLTPPAAPNQGRGVPQPQPRGGRGIPLNAPGPQLSGKFDYQNPDLPFDKRVADLVSKLTLAEKGQQVQMAIPSIRRGDFYVPGCNWWTEALHGVARNGRATIFPDAIGMAAAWDAPLMQKIADAIADEARAKYNDANTGAGSESGAYRGIIIWAPTVNMARDPRWGRTEECYGEDPLLSSRLGVAFCKGLQGDDPKYLKTVATPKHFAMYSQETGRARNSYQVSERTLREYYLPAFDACIHEGKATSIMAAYNGINGTPCMANSWLLTDLLRGEWRFEGAVTSDFLAPGYLMRDQQYSRSFDEVAADSINAGCDVLCDPMNLASYTSNAVRSGLLTEEVLDRAVSRGMMLRMRLGMFDPPDRVPFKKPPASVVGSKEHRDLALQSSREGIVLLKNDSRPRGFGQGKVLPLDLRQISKIAVVGPKANMLEYGNYSPNSPGGPAPSPAAALRTAVGERVTILTADYGTESAVKAASDADVAIVVVGLNQSIEFEGFDKQTLELPLDQKQLLERVVKANPLTIVVMQGGSVIGCEWIKKNVPAALMMWYPGEQGGNALAEILLGTTNPSGRLPMTFHRDVSDLPKLDDYEISHGRTYMYNQKPVSYSFGYGLSYTTFSYANLKLASSTVSPDQSLTVTFDLTNSGDRDGDEVPQLYVHKIDTQVAPRPLKQLKDFTRVTLTQGQTRNVEFKVPVSSISYWDEKNRRYAVEPGAYEVMIGPSSDDMKVKAEFQVK